MHGNVPVRFGRGRLDSLGNKGLAAYLIASLSGTRESRVAELLENKPLLKAQTQRETVKLAPFACRTDAR